MNVEVYNFKFKIMGGGNSKEKVIKNEAAVKKADPDAFDNYRGP